MMTRHLRTRFVLAALLFVGTAIASGVWSVYTFSRMSAAVGEALQQSQEKIDLTANLSQELELEDDALLLALTGNIDRASKEAADHRRLFDRSYAQLAPLISSPSEREAAQSLRENADAYRAAGDRLLADAQQLDKRTTYHEVVNPILRRAAADCARLRELTFRTMQSAGIQARDEARRAIGIVASVSFIALLVSTATALLLARSVVTPITDLMESVDALRTR